MIREQDFEFLNKNEFIRFKIYGEQNIGWGDLHIVLEDINCENSHVQWCIDNTNDPEVKYLGNILLKLTEDERIRMAEDFW